MTLDNISAKADEMMARDVVTTTPEASLREALDLMAENHVSGLPVLDRKDRCVGVVSASDILAIEQEHASHDDESLGSYFDADSHRWEHVRLAHDDERLEDVAVEDVMTRELVSVRPHAPMSEVARVMLENEVHRVLVVDHAQFLHGIVSALDFVQMATKDAD